MLNSMIYEIINDKSEAVNATYKGKEYSKRKNKKLELVDRLLDFILNKICCKFLLESKKLDPSHWLRVVSDFL